MFPIDIPPGTGVEALLEEILPAAHARLVSDDGDEEHRAVLRVTGGPSYTLEIRGRRASAARGEEGAPAVWVVAPREALERFLEDWATARRFVPRVDPSGFVMLTDPRVLRRVARVSGRLQLAIADFPLGDGRTERVAMTVGAGPAARQRIDVEEPDAVVEATTATVERVLSGALSPEDAIGGGHVKLTGKRLVAMQFALAIAPLFAKGP